MEEKLVAHDPSIGYVTRESRTLRRASELLCLPLKARLPEDRLAKRLHSEAKDTAIDTPVRETVRRTVLVHSTKALQYLLTVVDHLKCCSVKAAKDNKLTA